jgi:hypothetical protein
MSAETPQPVSRVMWRDPAEIMPDDEIAVLIALDDGTVTEAWHEDGRWHLDDRLSFSATPAASDRSPRVMTWAEMPDHPFADEIDLRWTVRKGGDE